MLSEHRGREMCEQRYKNTSALDTMTYSLSKNRERVSMDSRIPKLQTQ